MPTLSITVTSEVIEHVNTCIQKGGGYLVLARVEDRWEHISLTEVARIAFDIHLGPNKVWQPVEGAVLGSASGCSDDGTGEGSS